MRIKQVLTFSKIDYPIRFFIESSLKFNYQQSRVSNQPLIETPSYQLIVFLIVKTSGKFIKKNFEGVLSSFSDDQISVKIEGPTVKVNDIISNHLQIANFTHHFSDILIEAHISDSNNYDLLFQESLLTFDFIKLNHPVKLNQKIPLQQ